MIRSIGVIGVIGVVGAVLGAAALIGCGGDDRPSWEQGQPLAEPRTVVGQVDSTSNFEPLPGATVRLVTYDHEFSAGRTTTDAKGHFRFVDLDDPTYYVIVEHPDHLTEKFIAVAGKLSSSLKLTHRSQSPHLMWEPTAPIEPAMEQLVREAVVQKQPFAMELRDLQALLSELRQAEDDADEGGAAGDWVKVKRRLTALEAQLPATHTECVRGMIAHAAAKHSDPRLARAVKWIEEFRIVEQRYLDAKAALEHARAGKRDGTVSETDRQTAFELWTTTGRTWGEWKKRRDAVLDPAKRALMAIRATRERR